MKNGYVIGLALSAGLAGPVAAQTGPLILNRPTPGSPGWVSPAPIGQPAPVEVCFNKGTDPAYMARVRWLVELQNLAFFGTDYYLTQRWSGSQGTPRTLRWSFVPDGLMIGSGIGEPAAPSNLFAQMDAAFASQGGRATWVNRFQQVFDRWQELTGITYQRIRFNNNDWDDGAAWGSGGSSTRGDVRIAMHYLDGPSNVLAYNFFPSSGDMVLDSGDLGLFASSSNANRFLRNVVAHEHGHGMGLLHVCTNNSQILMEPLIDTAFDGPRQDDIRGAQAHYGDPYELNESFSAATPLGTLTNGVPITIGAIPSPLTGNADPNAALLSIDSGAKSDWYSFSTAGPATIQVVVTPIGSTYNVSQQTSSGCGSYSPLNALAAANLAVQVYDTNGTSLLASATAAAAGQPESTPPIPVSSGGTRYIRVYATSFSSAQSYRLTVTAQSPCPVFTEHPTDQLVCEATEVTFFAQAGGTPAPTYQWRKNGNIIPGATGETYTISAVTPNDEGTYDVIATNSCGSTTSNGAVLMVIPLPVFTQQPQSQTVGAGEPVTFSVQLEDSTGVTLQWRKNGANIPGATGTTYSIAAVQPGDQGDYDCRATMICGSSFSNVATLTIGSGVACYANCDGSTSQPVLNVNDFICFQTAFAAGDSYANCDGSTNQPILNVNDFICFQTQFAQGCP